MPHHLESRVGTRKICSAVRQPDINKFNMRLLDGNKEIEYNMYQNQIYDDSKNNWLMWVKVLINTTMVIFKVWKSFAGYSIDNIKADIDA